VNADPALAFTDTRRQRSVWVVPGPWLRCSTNWNYVPDRTAVVRSGVQWRPVATI